MSLIEYSLTFGNPSINPDTTFDDNKYLKNINCRPQKILYFKNGTDPLFGIETVYVNTNLKHGQNIPQNGKEEINFDEKYLESITCSYDSNANYLFNVILNTKDINPKTEPNFIFIKLDYEIIGFKGSTIGENEGLHIDSLGVYYKPLYIEFIGYLMNFYQMYKRDYEINYIYDEAISKYFMELNVYCKELNFSKVYTWYNEQCDGKDIKSKLEITISTLMFYNDKFKTIELEGFDTEFGYLVLGKRLWTENRIVFGENPFQNIRFIRLNQAEKIEFYKSIDNTRDNDLLKLFDNKLLKIQTCYMNKKISTSFYSAGKLNFGNYGFLAGFTLSIGSENMEQIYRKSMIKAVITDSIINLTNNNDIDILVFPELSIDNDDLDYLKTALNENETNNLKLVVAGSFHRKIVKDSDKYYNNVPILYKTQTEWKELTSYNKMIPFSTVVNENSPDKYIKDISIAAKQRECNTLIECIKTDNNVTLIKADKGFIGIAVCRDVLDLLDLNNPLHRYCDFIDLMIVISDNSGDTNMFVGIAEDLARWHNCATCYANTVSAIRANDSLAEVSFALYPYKSQSTISAVSGEITYVKHPFNNLNKGTYELTSNVGILNSKGIKYSHLNENEFFRTYEIDLSIK